MALSAIEEGRAAAVVETIEWRMRSNHLRPVIQRTAAASVGSHRRRSFCAYRRGVTDFEDEVGACERCGRSDWRATGRGEHALAWEALDNTAPAGRAELQDLFVMAGLLALLEVSENVPATVTLREVGVQVARTAQTAFTSLERLDSRGWVQIVERGNDAGDRHGDPDKGYLATVWRVGSPQAMDGGRGAVQGRRAARIAHELETFQGVLNERSRDWDRDDAGDPLPGIAGGYGDPEVAEWLGGVEAVDTGVDHTDVIPWLGDSGAESKPACHMRWNRVPAPTSDNAGRVTLSQARELSISSSGGSDSTACPAAGPSPIDYLTWSDAFLRTEAGVIGWWLARQQVAGFQPESGPPRHGWLPPLAGADVGRLCGITRQGGSEALRRLVDGGYAVPSGRGRYALKFRDLYWDGKLATSARSDHLAAQYVEEYRQRTIRNSRPEPGLEEQRDPPIS
jgi:hypothetical protein